MPTYIVDYDLPADHRRKRFYRAVHRYLRERMIEDTGWSTQSVVITKSEDFAWYVYHSARIVGGVAHVYEARLLKEQPRGEVGENAAIQGLPQE